MGLAVLPPDSEDEVTVRKHTHDVDSVSDNDVSMDDEPGRPSKRARLSSSTSRSIVLPGEVITDETEWMR